MARRPLVVKSVEGEWVRAERDDGAERRLALDNLLAVDAAGNGVHYRFQGWKPRPRGYRTEIRVVNVDVEAGRGWLSLPEWDAETEVEELLSALPPSLRHAGATGSCMADLASPSAAGLGIHACRAVKVRGLSRAAGGIHPDEVFEGQRYRRRSDGAGFRILEVTPGSRTVPAWNGQRTVRLTRERLLAGDASGGGRHYVYLGGGVRAARRRRGAPSKPSDRARQAV
jgi:hypothetical protein